MSELIKTNNHGKFLRGYLLASVCGLALATSAIESAIAQVDEKPTVWIELGGQLERMDNSSEVFSPRFLGKFDPALFRSPLPLQQSLHYSNGAEGRISFEPAGSSVVASASVRYGRSNGQKADYQRLPAFQFSFTAVGATHPTPASARPQHLNGATSNAERHLIVDFNMGKDIGIGALGGDNTSLVSAGLRFAQFNASTHTNINGIPDVNVVGHEFKYDGLFQSHHRYAGDVDVDRSFHGFGPSLSWEASALMLGRGDDSRLTFDWGLNGAVLFGRQKVSGERHVTGSHYKTMQKFPKYGTAVFYSGVASSYRHPNRIDRSRSVIVPNVGGFAGLSFRYVNAKLSLGYRADFFFGAMDGGIDTRRTYDRNFYGPFATVSIGLGG
jgi:hypothetical protein